MYDGNKHYKTSEGNQTSNQPELHIGKAGGKSGNASGEVEIERQS